MPKQFEPHKLTLLHKALYKAAPVDTIYRHTQFATLLITLWITICIYVYI